MKFERRKQKSSFASRYFLPLFLASVIGACFFSTVERRMTLSSSLLDEYVAMAMDQVQSFGSSPKILHTLPSNSNSDKLWTILVNHATDLCGSDNPGVAMEVGMHSANQCLEAAKAGLKAHCFEPSPTSFQRVKNQVEAQEMSIRKRVTIYNQAASSTSEGTIEFKSSGGTGDHVGGFDMWKMKASTDENDLKGEIVKVPQVRLDDVVSLQKDGVFALKVDTQGFEPIVFSGLSESLKQHRIKFVLFEYWPRGMDLHAGKQDACVAADLLSEFNRAGYTLYALTVSAHPKAPNGYKRVVSERPLDDFAQNCQWYFDLETRFPSPDYRMGYWSDILAVAPNATPDQELFVSKLGDWAKKL